MQRPRPWAPPVPYSKAFKPWVNTLSSKKKCCPTISGVVELTFVQLAVDDMTRSLAGPNVPYELLWVEPQLCTKL